MTGAFRKAMQRYAVHLAAVITIIVVSMLFLSYLLSHQRFYLPGWVPVNDPRLVSPPRAARFSLGLEW